MQRDVDLLGAEHSAAPHAVRVGHLNAQHFDRLSFVQRQFEERVVIAHVPNSYWPRRFRQPLSTCSAIGAHSWVLRRGQALSLAAPLLPLHLLDEGQEPGLRGTRSDVQLLRLLQVGLAVSLRFHASVECVMLDARRAVAILPLGPCLLLHPRRARRLRCSLLRGLACCLGCLLRSLGNGARPLRFCGGAVLGARLLVGRRLRFHCGLRGLLTTVRLLRRSCCLYGYHGLSLSWTHGQRIRNCTYCCGFVREPCCCVVVHLLNHLVDHCANPFVLLFRPDTFRAGAHNCEVLLS